MTLAGRQFRTTDGNPLSPHSGWFSARPIQGGVVEPMLRQGVWMLATIPALVAGWTDWRWRRIPNWLTVPALLAGIGLHCLATGWAGAKESLLGAGLGLGLLLPFVLIRSLGAGDWKLAGALGAFLGPSRMITVLLGTVLVAGLMAVILIIWKKRVGQTLRNLAHMFAALFTLHLPGQEVSLDNPESSKIPFGVAMAVTVVLYTVSQVWGWA
ncbi:MAG: prepilin peptidase [Terriglobales bacterium]